MLSRLWRSAHLFVALDARATIIDLNPSLGVVLEHPPASLQGRPLATLCAPEAPLEQVPTPDTDAGTCDKIHYPKAFTLLRPNLNRVHLHVVETWLVKSNGMLIYVLALATDGSENSTRAALEQYFDDLIHNDGSM